jgi:signal transduction histidine kinase
VGVVVFGFNLNGAIKKEIEKGTNTTVSFLKDQNNGAVRIALPDHSEQSVFLLLSNLGLSKIADGVQLNSLIAITILILLSSLFGYLLILFGFLKHFKLAAKQFELTAKDLERGVIVPVLPKRYFIHEVTGLFDSFSKVVANLKKFQEQVSLKSRVEAAGEKAAQVAHDLSGPLSALHMALAAEVPKKTVREIVARIEAVVSALSLTLPEDKTLNESQDAHSLSEIETLLIGLSTEKSIQYRSSNITLSLEMMPISVECEVRLNSAEFLRVVSNLLDNAFQAANSGGVVVLSTLTTADRYELRIKDNGCGISSEILSQLGQRGFSHQKRGGSGLGIWHANERINAWGGQLLFDSTLNIGTVVAVSLPVHSSAVKTISLDSSRGIVILDDDPSIHFWWKRKFASLFKQNSPTVIYLSSISEFWHWFSNESHTVQDPVYFFDFDLKDGTWDGLKLIEELQIQNEATLVTGHVDSRLKARCRKLKLRLIHKAQLNALEIIIKQKQFHKDRK